MRRGPVRRRPAPDAGAAESGRDLHHVTLLDPQPDLGGVRDHLDHVAVAALVHGLRHQRLEARADLARGQVARGGDELHPQRHGPLAPVAQLQHGAARDGAVVHEVKDAHLVEVEHHLELVGRDHLQAFVSVPGEGKKQDRLISFFTFAVARSGGRRSWDGPGGLGGEGCI